MEKKDIQLCSLLKPLNISQMPPRPCPVSARRVGVDPCKCAVTFEMAMCISAFFAQPMHVCVGSVCITWAGGCPIPFVSLFPVWLDTCSSGLWAKGWLKICASEQIRPSWTKCRSVWTSCCCSGILQTAQNDICLHAVVMVLHKLQQN